MKIISSDTGRQLARTVLVLKKNSPHLFFAGGMLGSITSTVLACRATLRLPETMDTIKTDISDVKERKANPTLVIPGRDYSERDYVHDLTMAYGRSVKSLIKLYGPSALLGLASTGALTGSHVQLTRRNSALTATAAALAKAYDEYRQRVRDIYGEEKELELHQALIDAEVERDGKTEKTKIPNKDSAQPYARVFDDLSPNWKKDPELNRVFLEHVQIWANNRLNARGHVFLNEVYDDLGLPRTTAGAICGWVLNGENSDNHIDFGLHKPANEKFMNGLERSAWLDFNVDGIIWDLIDE